MTGFGPQLSWLPTIVSHTAMMDFFDKYVLGKKVDRTFARSQPEGISTKLLRATRSNNTKTEVRIRSDSPALSASLVYT